MMREKMPDQGFFDRAENSRQRIKSEFDLGTDPENYKIFEEKSGEIFLAFARSMQASRNPKEMGEVIDRGLGEIQGLFANDEYGKRARDAMFARIREKAVDEISDWLKDNNKDVMIPELSRAAASWENALYGADWIEKNILSQFPEREMIFADARDAKAQEIIVDHEKRARVPNPEGKNETT